MYKKGEKDKNMKEKGITLIALIVTIIVLAILAGVSISVLVGDQGIIRKTQNTGEDAEKESVREQALIDISSWVYDEVTGRKSDGIVNTPEQIQEILEKENEGKKKYYKGFTDEGVETPSGYIVPYEDLYNYGGETTGGTEVGEKPGKPDENGLFTERSTINGQTTGSKNNPLIPVGFKPVDEGDAVWGDGTKAPAQSSVDAGLVIEDGKENQFVWVPVDYSEFVRREGYSGGILQSVLSDCGEADSTGSNSKLTETTTTQTEARAMYASVEINGGFYIGRYEAGKDASGKVVVKQGADVYNMITWSANAQMQETNGTTGGAVELARNFDTVNNYTGVTSTLIYGVQWDTVMKWMENVENPNVDGKKYIQNSTGMGWYSDNLSGNPSHKTGIDLDGGKNKVKNIYDLAGNVREWTMESYGTDYRVYRGGDGEFSCSIYPVSNRSRNYPYIGGSSIGFRVTLYLQS